MAARKTVRGNKEPKASRPHMPGYISTYTKGLLPWKWAEPVFVVRASVVFGQVEKTFAKTATRWKFGK